MYAIGRSIVQRLALKDPFLQNVDFKTVPGAFASSTLFDRVERWTAGASFEYPLYDVIEVRDNVGNYRQGTSQAGLEYVVSVVTFSVVTSRGDVVDVAVALGTGSERLLGVEGRACRDDGHL